MSSQKSTLTPILKFAHLLAQERLQPGDTAIDATMGNGHDTLLLAQAVGPKGRVYAFDIQAQALEKTHQRLTEHGCLEQVHLIQDSHAHLCQHVQEPAKVIFFNLGYLPGAQKHVTTLLESSQAALEQSLQLLPIHGVVLLCVYPGHEEGARESEYLLPWLKALDQKQYQVLFYGFINQVNHPPYLVVIEKLA